MKIVIIPYKKSNEDNLRTGRFSSIAASCSRRNNRVHVPRERHSELQVLHGDGMVRQPAFSGLEPCRVQFTQSVLKERAPACFLFRMYHRHDIRDFSQQQAYRPPSGCKTLPVSGFQQPEDVFRRTEARYPALLPAQTATALYRPSSCLADDPL